LGRPRLSTTQQQPKQQQQQQQPSDQKETRKFVFLKKNFFLALPTTCRFLLFSLDTGQQNYFSRSSFDIHSRMCRPNSTWTLNSA
jgi:hypothetical protein